MCLFADDSIIYHEIVSEDDHFVLQTDLEELMSWAQTWQMDFNVTECYLMSITIKTNHNLFPYSMLNQPLSHVHHSKYLGVTIDSNLSWNEHITLTVAKSCETLGLVKRTLGPCKPSVKETVYNTCPIPKLEYGAVTWNPHTKSNIQKLEKVQLSAASIVCGNHRCTLINSAGRLWNNRDYTPNSKCFIKSTIATSKSKYPLPSWALMYRHEIVSPINMCKSNAEPISTPFTPEPFVSRTPSLSTFLPTQACLPYSKQ